MARRMAGRARAGVHHRPGWRSRTCSKRPASSSTAPCPRASPPRRPPASSKSTWPTPGWWGKKKGRRPGRGRARGPARHAPPRAHDPADEHQYGLRRRALPPSGGDGRGASLLALQRDPRRLDAALAPRARRQGVPGRRPIWDRIYPPNGFGCRCRVRAISEREARREGVEVLSGQAGLADSPPIPLGLQPRQGRLPIAS